MRWPHTHFTKGKTVWVRLRDGDEIIGRFVERRARVIVLENARIPVRSVAAMSLRRIKHSGKPMKTRKTPKLRKRAKCNGESRCVQRVDMPLLTPRQVISELKGEVEVYQRSYSELDGQVRDKGALRTIAALKQAAEIVKRHIVLISHAVKDDASD